MLLEIKNIYKSFGPKEVLKDINLSIKSGYALGLLGRNGAGKTTLMRILMKFFLPDRGEIILNGQSFNPEDFKIGYLPEERGLYPKKEIREQLIFLGQLKGLNKKEAESSSASWLARLGLEEDYRKKLNTLSKGNQQKVQLAASLINNPDIIILDEPFSGLDPVNALLLKDIVKEQVEKNKLVIFSSHQMNYVEEFCNEIALINQGTIVLHDSIHNIKKSYSPDLVSISFTNSQEIGAINTFLDEYTYLCQEEEVDIDRQGYAYSFKIKLKDRKDKDLMLKALLAANYSLENFQTIEPSLEEIFIEKAGEAI